MKAIKVTKKHKDDNPKLFKNYSVWEIVKLRPPNQFVRDGNIILGYDINEQQQSIDGFKELVRPIIAETEKLGDIIDDGDTFTYEVLNKTADELDDMIPKTLSKLKFKTRLLSKHNITDEQVDTIINGIEDDIMRAKVKLMWYQADYFERHNPYLYQFAPALGLTETDIVNLFKDE